MYKNIAKFYTVHLCKCACMTCVTAIYCHWKWRTFVKLTEINLINTAIIAISTMTRIVNFLFKKHYAFFECEACPLESLTCQRSYPKSFSLSNQNFVKIRSYITKIGLEQLNIWRRKNNSGLKIIKGIHKCFINFILPTKLDHFCF